MAFADSLDRLTPAFDEPVFLNRLKAILGAGWIKAAATSYERGDDQLVTPY